jgi:hypothetical protein
MNKSFKQRIKYVYHALGAADISECLDTIREMESTIKGLEVDLERNRCNSGHTTLPLRLWTCPRCVEIKEEENANEIAKLKELLRQTLDKLKRVEAEEGK